MMNGKLIDSDYEELYDWLSSKVPVEAEELEEASEAE